MSAWEDIESRIRIASQEAGRAQAPELLAVSKKQSLEKMLQVYQQGQRIFGENYVQELVEKKQLMLNGGADQAEFHFIGHLQTNKVKLLIEHVSVIHSVHSTKLLREIAKRAAQIEKKIQCYFEVNIDAEESKSGFLVGELDELSKSDALKSNWIEVMGLMGIPAPDRNPRDSYARLSELSRQYQKTLGAGLSMGMSNDFEVAIEYGATIVRVGSALFGSRV